MVKEGRDVSRIYKTEKRKAKTGSMVEKREKPAAQGGGNDLGLRKKGAGKKNRRKKKKGLKSAKGLRSRTTQRIGLGTDGKKSQSDRGTSNGSGAGA